MYTCTKPFPNFLNLCAVNKVDICDVTFKGGCGVHYCDGEGGGGSGEVESVVTLLMDTHI